MREALVVGDEVREALDRGSAVVALETSVIGQGLPHPENLECAERMSTAIRGHGAVPAWTGVLDGAVRVGLAFDDLARLSEPGGVTKVARRDLPMAVATRTSGATTVSATIWAAASAGIRIGATGGIGGVHPGDEPDVSADLMELARTPGLLVCSGPKSIIDPELTAARLEELGVALIGFGTDRLPFFLAREASVRLEHRVDSPAGAATALAAALALGIGSTILVCNPVPEHASMDIAEVASATTEAEARAVAEGVRGKDRTPFLLRALAQITGGRSLEANLALLEHNASVAAEVAAAYSPG
jgi:pseudouridine-5'-phosphate glycosidase